MPITGYDISSNNPNFGGYDTVGVSWCAVKASEGASYKNPLRFAQAHWARSRGLSVPVYHWVKPHADPRAQVANFAGAVAGMGEFAWWALDIEDPEAASPAQWLATLEAIAAGLRARPEFGDREVDYLGRFFQRGALEGFGVRNGQRWLPDYGHNDGAVHPISPGAPPMIHQFTSAHGLDRNIVTDEAAYQRLVGQPAPPPPPAPLEEDTMTYLFESKAGTLYLYDEGIVNKLSSNNLVKAFNAGRALEHKPLLEPITVEDDAAADLAALAAAH